MRNILHLEKAQGLLLLTKLIFHWHFHRIQLCFWCINLVHSFPWPDDLLCKNWTHIFLSFLCCIFYRSCYFVFLHFNGCWRHGSQKKDFNKDLGFWKNALLGTNLWKYRDGINPVRLQYLWSACPVLFLLYAWYGTTPAPVNTNTLRFSKDGRNDKELMMMMVVVVVMAVMVMVLNLFTIEVKLQNVGSWLK